MTAAPPTRPDETLQEEGMLLLDTRDPETARQFREHIDAQPDIAIELRAFFDLPAGETWMLFDWSRASRPRSYRTRRKRRKMRYVMRRR